MLNGWALAYQKYSKDYVDEEGLARKYRQNIWDGQITPPWEWRAGGRGPADENEGYAIGNAQPQARETQAATSSCTVKGNITGMGERVYHVPGSHWYAKTAINITQGERWFCTEEEARSAGWRKARKRDQPRTPSVGIEPVDVLPPR